jgi:hypothetical protein
MMNKKIFHALILGMMAVMIGCATNVSDSDSDEPKPPVDPVGQTQQTQQDLKIGIGGAGGGGLSFNTDACQNDCWARFPNSNPANFRRWLACMDHCDCVAEGRCIDL